MDTHLPSEAESWLDLVGSREAVLGPSRGHVPDLSSFRIARLYVSPDSMWMFGCVTGMPPEAESNGELNGLRKFNLALQVSLQQVLSLSGRPELDSQHDDCMHGFELALPVRVTAQRTSSGSSSSSPNGELELIGISQHLNFRVHAWFVHAFGGKHARKRFTEAFHVGY